MGCKIRPVVAGGHQQIGDTLGPVDLHLHPGGIHQRLPAHGPHDAGGTQDGDAAFDTQPGVEGLCGQQGSLRHGDHRLQAPLFPRLVQRLPQLVPDHLPRARIDGSSPYRLVQARSGHPAHALPAVNADVCFGPADRGYHQRAVGHVAVVTAVLPDTAGGPVRPPPHVLRLQQYRNARRGLHPDLGREVAPQQGFRRRPGRTCGAGARGIAAAQPLLPHGNIVFQHGRLLS